MDLPHTVLITDVGSTTTKALFFERRGDGYKLLANATSPTTVEAPEEDVRIGLINAAEKVGERLGKKITDNGKLLAGSAFDEFLSTSSAGGGLQILVSGLTRAVTAKSAFRAACVAGGVILDTLAADDGRTPHEKVRAIENLRPDMLLIAGGIDGGDVSNVVRTASMLLAARLKPKYLPEGKMPVVFAGNRDARPMIEALMRGRAELITVDNLRPKMDEENLFPTSAAIHEAFAEHVMARAPGYNALKDWAALPVEPTPSAAARMLGVISKARDANIIMVDVGGATTDVFSFYDGRYSRTVSASLGMSYSAGGVLSEAGVENVSRWLTADLPERDIRNTVANKCINPTTLPANDVAVEVEQALAREALRLAFKTHRELSVSVNEITGLDRLRALFSRVKNFKEDRYVRMKGVSFIYGSGGVLSEAPEPRQTAMMLIDGLEPEGITDLGVDSVFMLPHLGMLARLSESAAYNTFLDECYVRLGTCVALSGGIVRGRRAAEITLHVGGSTHTLRIDGGELAVIPARADEWVDIEISPARKVDAGIGPGRGAFGRIRGGEAGIIIDARGRPVMFSEDPDGRRADSARWCAAFDRVER